MYCTFASKQAVSITLFEPRPNKKLQRPSLVLTEDHKWSIFDLFCYEASEPTLVAVEAKPEVEIHWNLDLTKSSI